MNNTTGRMLSSAAALLAAAAAGPAAAATVNAPPPAQPASYADLLDPIPNAVALVKADDAARGAQPARVQLAQYHHHHHHHHHHHQNWRYYRGPHCYWTWGAPFWNGFRWVPRHIRVCN